MPTAAVVLFKHRLDGWVAMQLTNYVPLSTFRQELKYRGVECPHYIQLLRERGVRLHSFILLVPTEFSKYTWILLSERLLSMPYVYNKCGQLAGTS